jgi:eukaryotic-like serine/threonine-protein kinase
MLMVEIPPGRFLMGSPRNEDRREEDEVQHEVRISSGFHMGATEVTQAQWEKVMGTNPAAYQADTSPMNLVNWNDAQEFCRRLTKLDGRSYRLPTEAEWEYACRAGASTPAAASGGRTRMRQLFSKWLVVAIAPQVTLRILLCRRHLFPPFFC